MHIHSLCRRLPGQQRRLRRRTDGWRFRVESVEATEEERDLPEGRHERHEGLAISAPHCKLLLFLPKDVCTERLKTKKNKERRLDFQNLVGLACPRKYISGKIFTKIQSVFQVIWAKIWKCALSRSVEKFKKIPRSRRRCGWLAKRNRFFLVQRYITSGKIFAKIRSVIFFT